jgi:chemotaxis response regulator CheB
MTEGLKPSKLAEALNKAAENFVPKSKGTLAAQLEDPEVKDAIINMRRKGMTAVDIVDVLKTLGIETTPSSFNSTFGRILRKSKGGSDAKPRKDRKPIKATDNPATSVGSSEGGLDGSPKPSESNPTETGSAKHETPTTAKPAVSPAYRDRRSL